ncbi:MULTISPECIES: AzlD domain-containing protein [Halomonadaceae]|uniref:AzlD family protein n=1 Tax=Halomonadaceae TaxID=28256 RepID=UPI0030ED0F0B
MMGSWASTSGVASLVAITMMIVIALVSRIGGLLIMSRLPIGPKVRRFVDAMATSVLIAVITPMVVDGDGGTRIAALIAGAVAIWLRSPLVAIAMGMLSAALWRFVMATGAG